LEVLIAVPLITCLVVLGLFGGVGVQHVAGDLHPAPPTYVAAPLPPTLNPTAYDSPKIVPTTLPAPVAVAPVALAPSACTSLPPCPIASDYCSASADVAAALPPLSPHVSAIVEVQAQVKSPLAESSLAGAPDALRNESVAALARVAADSSLPELPALTLPPPTAEPVASLKPNPVAPESAPAAPSTPTSERSAADCPARCQAPSIAAPHSIATSLQAAADHLYEKAQSLEADGHFDRADHLRSLARDLRREISALRGEETGPPASSVKATSYHEPVAEKPAKTSDTTGPSPRLLPARAELAEPMPQPPLMLPVQPRIIIQEEEESRLGIDIAPENPAP
jgi:hypothetical protein